jgi:hypothetical protein
MMRHNDYEKFNGVRMSVVLLTVAMTLPILQAVATSGDPMKGLRWTHFIIADPLPGSSWGTGGIPLADFDGDGDLDIVLSRRETETAYWFERKDDATWARHTIGRSPGLKTCLGAASLDINRDGAMDVVLSQVWFENPKNLGQAPNTPWPAHAFVGRGHDMIVADIDGDGYQDIVTYGGTTVSWFDISANMQQIDIGAGEENHGRGCASGRRRFVQRRGYRCCHSGLLVRQSRGGTHDLEASCVAAHTC